MINNLWLYSFLPAIPALSCILLLAKLHRKKAEWYSIRLFANLLLMNLLQTVAYIVFSISVATAEYIADLYLISAYFFFTHLMIFALQLSKDTLSVNQTGLLYIFPSVLTVFHLLGLMVDSYRVENDALLHNDGPLAWCLDVYILSSCVATVVLFSRNIKRNLKNRMLMSKNVVALLSFAPLIVAFFIIVLLSMTRYAIPVVFIGPLVTLYTSLAFYYISRKTVVDLSIGFGFFCDRLKLAYQFLETHKTKEDLKRFHHAVDKQFIKEALKENNFHIQETADYLGINHTTLRNKIKSYNLCL